MQGKKLNEFIDSLYFNPEMEITFSNKRFLISGYYENNEYTLRIDSIELDSINIFCVKGKTAQDCVNEFEHAKLFEGRTIYEAHNEITVLFG
ncbi:MAG: hypothetical protein E7613_09300 [Ruminococcaceae bacterium]|nr:hypothetical protein [Oscillospiraceae bacterium]